jgi:hypothetical protein
LLRGACHRAALRADPVARNDGPRASIRANPLARNDGSTTVDSP